MINPPSAEKAQLLQGASAAEPDDETFAAIRAVLRDAETDFGGTAPDSSAEATGSVERIAQAVQHTEVLNADRGPAVRGGDVAKVLDHEPKRPRKLNLPRIALPGFSVPTRSLLGFRPKPKHGLFFALLLVLLFKPQWVVLSLLLVVFIVLGIFAIAGADAVWSALSRHFVRMAERNPQRAARLAVRMDAFALKWDAILDRFPEHLVEGLYLPDFQAYQQADERHAAAVDARLSRMQGEA